ncbi:MAG: rRNA biogenesis protein rrp5 [Epulopiscium sp.]|nr:rRNA biogenesis protein rrp5 [Candidatus Epulonipiscium sp.]
MSKMKLALDVVENLRSLADSIEILAESVTDKNDTDVEKVIEPATPKITFEDLRAVLAVLTRSGKQAEVKELIEKYDAKKLSDVPEDKYHELLDAAGKLQ